MPHKPQLDGLRFLAFLAVFFFHARPGKYSWGPQGVQVFFTLSGFLITRILILGESGSLASDLKRFYIRRTLRIFPLYYAVVGWLWASGLLAGVGWYLAYLYNVRAYLIRGWGGPVGHFWTLCVEEQFYLLYPLALLTTPPRRRLAMLGLLILGTKAFQAYAHARLSIPWSSFLLPYCGEHLLWGCVAGLVEIRTGRGFVEGPAGGLSGVPGGAMAPSPQPSPARGEGVRKASSRPANEAIGASRAERPWGPIALILGVALMVLTRARPGWAISPPPSPVILGAFTGFGIGSALVVFGLWRTSTPWIVGPLAWRPVAYLGRISYGLYVYHLLAIERNWVMYIPESYLIPEPYGTLLATVAVASASWYLLENPINRLKDRLTGRSVRSGPPIDSRESRGSGG